MTRKKAKSIVLTLIMLLSVVAMTATVPMTVGAAAPSSSTDNTAEATVTAGNSVTVADVSYSTSGNVSDVFVQLDAGGSATAQAGDVDSITVTLRNSSSGVLATASATESGAFGAEQNISVAAGNVTGVDRIVVSVLTAKAANDSVLQASVRPNEAVTDAGSSVTSGNTQTIEAAGHQDLINAGTYWQGQTVIHVDGAFPNTDYTVTDNDTNQLVLERTSDASGELTFSTSSLDGIYDLRRGGNKVLTGWQVSPQTLDVDFADASVVNEGSGSSTELEIDSNRGSFTAEISATGLDEAELEDIFGTTDGTDDDVLSFTVSGGEAVAADFANIDTGSYDFTVEAADTTASGTASIDVSEPGDETALFPASIVDIERGDIAEFTVTFQNTDTATVTVGSSGVNYEVELTLTDGDGDGEVVVQMNTYIAGRRLAANEDQAWNTADSDDSISVTRNLPSNPLSQPLTNGDYERTVEVQRGATTIETDVGTLFIGERSTDAVNVWTAPAGETVSSVEDIQQALAAGTLTEDSRIAVEDVAVLQVQATGIFGAIEDAPGASSTDKLQNLAANESIVVSLTQTNPAANQDPLEMRLDGNGVTAVSDEENDTLFVVLDVSELQFDRDGSPVSDSAEAGDNWEAEFSVREPSLLVSENESVTDTFELVEGAASFRGLTVEDELPVAGTSNAEVRGTSTLAPGTEFTIRLRSTSTDTPFLKQQTVTVQADGTWSATFDMSGLPDDTTFTASIIGPIATVEAPGFIGEPVEDGGVRTVIVTQPSPTPRVVTQEVTRVVRETVVQDRTVIQTRIVTQTPGQPGFGIAVAIVALLAAALLAVRRRD